MFKNIGTKIKSVAKAICIIGILISAIGGIAVALGFALSVKNVTIGAIFGVIIGIIYTLFGSFASWIGSFTLYGYGELIHNSKKSLEVQEAILLRITEKQASDKKVWKCSKCGFEVSNDYSYCPFCQYTSKDKKENSNDYFKIEIPED